MEIGKVDSMVEKNLAEVKVLQKEAVLDVSKKLEPTTEALARVEKLPVLIRNSELGQFVERLLPYDISIRKTAEEARRSLEKSREQMSFFPRYLTLVDRAASGKSNEKLPDVDLSSFAGIKETFNKAVDTLIKCRKDKLEARGTRLRNVSFESDAHVLQQVVTAEKRANAFGVDLAKGMVEINTATGFFSNVELDKFKKMSSEMRPMASAMAVEFDNQKKSIDALMRITIDRRPGSAVKIRGDADRLKNNIDLSINQGVENPLGKIDIQSAGKSLEQFYKDKGMTDSQVLVRAMEKSGFVFDKNKNEYKVTKESPYMLYLKAHQQYSESVNLAKSAQANGESDPNGSLSTYLKVNRVVESGNAVLMAEQQMKYILMEAKAQQDRVNWHDKIKNEAALKKVDQKIASLQKEGFVENISRRISGFFKAINERVEKPRIKKLEESYDYQKSLLREKSRIENLKNKSN